MLVQNHKQPSTGMQCRATTPATVTSGNGSLWAGWINECIWHIKPSTQKLVCSEHQMHIVHVPPVGTHKLKLPKTFIPIKYTNNHHPIQGNTVTIMHTNIVVRWYIWSWKTNQYLWNCIPLPLHIHTSAIITMTSLWCWKTTETDKPPPPPPPPELYGIIPAFPLLAPSSWGCQTSTWTESAGLFLFAELFATLSLPCFNFFFFFLSSTLWALAMTTFQTHITAVCNALAQPSPWQEEEEKKKTPPPPPKRLWWSDSGPLVQT